MQVIPEVTAKGCHSTCWNKYRNLLDYFRKKSQRHCQGKRYFYTSSSAIILPTTFQWIFKHCFTSIIIWYEETYPFRNRVRFYMRVASLSIRNCKVLLKLTWEMFYSRKSWTNSRTSSTPHFIFCHFKVSMDAIIRVSNSSCSITLWGFFCYFLSCCGLYFP